MKKLSLILLLVTTLDCVIGKQSVTRYEELLTDNTPTCFNGERKVICLYLTANDMGLLEKTLRETAIVVPTFSVQIESSDGPAIPLGIFSGYSLDAVFLFNDNFPSIPYELLSSVESPIDGLYVDYDNFTSTETVPPSVVLPFSEHLIHFEMMETNIISINAETFTSYPNLKKLELGDNQIEAIGSELQQLHQLINIEVSRNSIASIETGAFGDLENLEHLDLSVNNLSTLQEGAFSGLETSPIAFIDLSNNPWNCTCDLQWLKDWLTVRGLTESSGAMCRYPEVASFTDLNFC